VRVQDAVLARDRLLEVEGLQTVYALREALEVATCLPLEILAYKGLQMNRRSFLAMLAGAITEPLVPKGTAFSFLGGVYRPEWVETPTAWPIPLVELYEGQSLVIEGPTNAGGLELYAANLGEPLKMSRSPLAPKGAAATIMGLSPFMNRPKLFRNRAGSWLIRESGEPMQVEKIGDLELQLTFSKETYEKVNTAVSWVAPKLSHGETTLNAVVG